MPQDTVLALDKAVPPEIFGAFNRGVFTSIDRKLLAGVSVHVALFLENRKLFQDTESLMMGLLHSLVAAVDAKDAYTCGHSVRVGLYAKRLAEAAGFEPRFADRAYLAGLLHDVGKIGVDDAVLRKPGKLTAEEFAQIQRHPEIGFRILKGIAQVQDILPGVLGRMGLDRKRAEAEVARGWNHLIDPTVTAHARPTGLHKGPLFVTVDSSVWLSEIVRYRRREILERLQHSFGQDLITRISFRAG